MEKKADVPLESSIWPQLQLEASYIKCFHNESNGVVSNAITVFKPSKLAGRGPSETPHPQMEPYSRQFYTEQRLTELEATPKCHKDEPAMAFPPLQCNVWHWTLAWNS